MHLAKTSTGWAGGIIAGVLTIALPVPAVGDVVKAPPAVTAKSATAPTGEVMLEEVHACCLPQDDCRNLVLAECLSNCESDDSPVPCTTDADCPGPRTCGIHQCHNGTSFTGRACHPGAGGGCKRCSGPPYNYCFTNDDCAPGQSCNSSEETCALFDPTICTPKCGRWFSDALCSDPAFQCPRFACFDATGDCFAAEQEVLCSGDHHCPPGETCIIDWGICSRRVGCYQLACCDAVCRDEPYCCDVAWDSVCVNYAQNSGWCSHVPGNDECFHSDPGRGAFQIELHDESTHGICTINSGSCSGWAPAGNELATDSGSDPTFCCNNLGVDLPGEGTIWYKFTAFHHTALIHTCDSSGFPFQDSLIQVFEAQDPTSGETACNTLQVIGCSDDRPGCGDYGLNASVCVTGLTRGETYYILMASSTLLSLGDYLIDVESPCPAATLPPAATDCASAEYVFQPLVLFDLHNATMDCPAEPELPGLTNDLWWQYQSSCAGKLIVDTCWVADPDDPRPATNLAVYESWTCPPDTTANRAWFNNDADFGDKFCVRGGQACDDVADCVMGCAGGSQQGELCGIDAQCPGSWCDTFPQGECIAHPYFPDHVPTGDRCMSDTDCTFGLCAPYLSDACDAYDYTLRCAGGLYDGELCFENVQCPGGTCEPPCGWYDATEGLLWACIPMEVCDQAGCFSPCVPGSHLEIPVFAGESFMIRVGGEFGAEPAGVLSVQCKPDDCNYDYLPDLWQIENGILADCNQNREPDICDLDPSDPDGNGDMSKDCNYNGVPDECEIAQEASVFCIPGQHPCDEGPFYCAHDCDPDVDANGIPDLCGDRCPDGDFTWPFEMIDARQPHAPADPTPQGAMDTITVEGPRGADDSAASPCWLYCEASVLGPVDNGILAIEGSPITPESMGTCTYTITLEHPIAVGALAMITYTTDAPSGNTYVGKFAVLPGDVNGDRIVQIRDVQALIGCLNGAACHAWQADINRSGTPNAQDLLRLIDLLIGAGQFNPWLGQSVPTACP